MKKFSIFTTALAALLASATVSATVPAFTRDSYSPLAQASAKTLVTAALNTPKEAAEETIYPEDFTSEITFTALSDYAINGDVFSFAEGTVIKTVETDELGDRKMTTHNCGFEIKHLDYKEGKLYLGNAEGKAYTYPDLTPVENYTFEYFDRLEVAESNYFYILSKGNLTCYDDNNESYEFGEGYSPLKVYDNVVYTVKDNVLYSISGKTISPVELGFTDFSPASSVLIAGAKQALHADYTVNTVDVKSGAYCTEIDLSNLDGEHFKQIKTIKLSGSMAALELCKSGNASIIAMNDGNTTKAYLTLTSSLESTQYNTPECDLTDAFTLQEVKLYSVPYICGASVKTVLPARAVVKVEEKFSLSFTDTEFYKVSYTDESGKTIKGYIAKGFLSPYTFSAEQNKADSVKDEFKYENNVQTVVLVLIIVGLVIIAVVYLVMVGTKGKKSKNKKNTTPNITDDENL